MPVQPSGDLTACLQVAIQFAEDGTHNEGNIERYRYFMSEVMPDCFDKVLFSKETSGWNHDIMRSVVHTISGTPFLPRPPAMIAVPSYAQPIHTCPGLLCGSLSEDAHSSQLHARAAWCAHLVCDLQPNYGPVEVVPRADRGKTKRQGQRSCPLPFTHLASHCRVIVWFSKSSASASNAAAVGRRGSQLPQSCCAGV